MFISGPPYFILFLLFTSQKCDQHISKTIKEWEMCSIFLWKISGKFVVNLILFNF